MQIRADPETLGGDDAPLPFVAEPSRDSADRLARLRLIRSRRVGPTTYRRLMAEHGDAAAALEALPGLAAAAGVSGYAVCPGGVALAEMKAAKRCAAAMLCIGDPGYPSALAEITDAPPVLWAVGRPQLLARPAIALIGTRNASSLGARMARRLAAELGEAGFVVVSGLARGIDALAHDAALATGTVAVMAGGVDVPYPAENTDLAAKIGRDGCRLSEQPPGLQPQARHFPRRNRIVSGLAQAVVVVEAAARSGSLITARAALDQGREVMAIPGHPMDGRAGGCNMLIRDGATLVRGAEDVIDALAPRDTACRPPRPDVGAPAATPGHHGPDPGALAAAILDRLGPSPADENLLCRDLGTDAASLSRTLGELELAGRVERRPGGQVALSG